MKWFEKSEFDCKCGCGLNNISSDLTMMLDEAREEAGVPFVINSGCRCKKHNTRVKGSKTSSHPEGLAADIKATSNRARFRILTGLLLAGFSRILIYKRFIHVDIDMGKPQEIIKLMQGGRP